MEEVLAKFLKDLGYKVYCHRTDFELGVRIERNIEDATVHSRRIICVISR